MLLSSVGRSGLGTSNRTSFSQKGNTTRHAQGTHAHTRVSDSSVTPWTAARRAPLSMGFPRLEYWSWVPFPPPEDLLDPGSSLHLLCLPRWQAGSGPVPPRMPTQGTLGSGLRHAWAQCVNLGSGLTPLHRLSHQGSGDDACPFGLAVRVREVPYRRVIHRGTHACTRCLWGSVAAGPSVACQEMLNSSSRAGAGLPPLTCQGAGEQGSQLRVSLPRAQQAPRYSLGYCKSLSLVRLFVIHGLEPVRPLCLQDSPGKNTGAACRCLLRGIFQPGIEPASLTPLAPAGLQSPSSD